MRAATSRSRFRSPPSARLAILERWSIGRGSFAASIAYLQDPRKGENIRSDVTTVLESIFDLRLELGS